MYSDILATHGGAWNSRAAASGSGDKWVAEKSKVELETVLDRRLEVGSAQLRRPATCVAAEMAAMEGGE